LILAPCLSISPTLRDRHAIVRTLWLAPCAWRLLARRGNSSVAWAPRTTRLIFRPTRMLPRSHQLHSIAIAITIAVRSLSSCSWTPSPTSSMLRRDRGDTLGRNGLVWPIARFLAPWIVDTSDVRKCDLHSIKRRKKDCSIYSPTNISLTTFDGPLTGSTSQCQSDHRRLVCSIAVRSSANTKP
jgi:hypothetical protein